MYGSKINGVPESGMGLTPVFQDIKWNLKSGDLGARPNPDKPID